MDKLSYSEKREIERVVESRVDKRVDERLSKNALWDSVINLLDKLHLEQQIRDKTKVIVPEVCDSWVKNNLRNETESISNNYMRNNFQKFFRQEVSENKEVNGFIASHLEAVALQVTTTTNHSIDKILETDPKFNPVFQSYLAILSQRNESKLQEMTKDIRKSKETLDNTNRQNADLHKRIKELEHSNKISTIFHAVLFAGVAGLGVNSFLNMSRL